LCIGRLFFRVGRSLSGREWGGTSLYYMPFGLTWGDYVQWPFLLRLLSCVYTISAPNTARMGGGGAGGGGCGVEVLKLYVGLLPQGSLHTDNYCFKG